MQYRETFCHWAVLLRFLRVDLSSLYLVIWRCATASVPGDQPDSIVQVSRLARTDCNDNWAKKRDKVSRAGVATQLLTLGGRSRLLLVQ